MNPLFSYAYAYGILILISYYNKENGPQTFEFVFQINKCRYFLL